MGHAAKALPPIVFFAAQLLPKINMELWFRALETRRRQKQLISKESSAG